MSTELEFTLLTGRHTVVLGSMLESLGHRWHDAAGLDLDALRRDFDVLVVAIDVVVQRPGLAAWLTALSEDEDLRIWAVVDGEEPDVDVRFHDELHVPISANAVARRILAHQEWRREVAARRAARDLLRASEAAYRAIVEKVPVAIWRADASGEGGYVNELMTEIMGISRERALGSGWADALHPDDRERIFTAWQAFAAGDAPYKETYRFVHGDGTVRWVIGQAVRVGDDGVGPQGHLGTLTDITELVEAREKLAAAREQLAAALRLESLGRIAGGLAHDFNNLLTVISANADLALSAPTLGESRSEITAILDATERAAVLVGKLLAFGRRQVLQTRIFDLNVLIEELHPLLSSLVGAKGTLALELGEALSPVRADPRQVEQVVMNLIANARDSISETGRIAVRTTLEQLTAEAAARWVDARAGSFVCIEVSDDGCGMDAETKARVFEPFFTTKLNGTGLGLASSFGIVRQSDGFVVLSSRLGEGTSVRVFLPASDGEAVTTKTSDESVVRHGSGLVMVVDDIDAVRSSLVRGLERLGYQVVQAGSVAEARSVAASAPALDVLVCDVVMPDGGGAAAVRAVRESHPEVQLVWMSGHADDSLVANGALERGATFLQKPFPMRRLAETIGELARCRGGSEGS